MASGSGDFLKQQTAKGVLMLAIIGMIGKASDILVDANFAINPETYGAWVMMGLACLFGGIRYYLVPLWNGKKAVTDEQNNNG